MTKRIKANIKNVWQTMCDSFLFALRCGGMGLVLIGISIWGNFPAWGNDMLQKKPSPTWSGEHIQIDISPYLPQSNDIKVHIEFAAKNEPYILFWSLDLKDFFTFRIPLYRYANIASGISTVLDSSGDIVHEATDAHGNLRPPYVAMFPKVSPRQIFTEFIRDAEQWKFSEDGMYGMKSERCSAESFSAFCHVQAWDMVQHTLLWEKEYEGRNIYLAEFLFWEEIPCLLIAFDHGVAVVSRETGDILGGFNYLLSKEQASHLTPGNFYPFTVVYNAAKRWLACGEFEGRRVRIFSVDPPYPVIRDLSTDIPPHSSLGGGWMVNEVDFNANGKYLIVQYEYSGRHIETPHYPTEIYDTDTWEVVWYENTEEVYAVTVSPNGEKIAFLRDTILEMGDLQTK